MITPTARGIVTRSQWLAAPPKRAPLTLTAPAAGLGVHHGASTTPTDHAKCLSTWRGYQRYHLAHPTEDYSDIAYCLGFCTHGYVFIGRGDGWTTQGGANGTREANRRYFSACFIGTGTQGFSDPAKAALLYIIDRLRRAGHGLAVKPHRYFTPGATACPSDPIAAFIAAYDGRALPTPPPPIQEDPDMTPEQHEMLKTIWHRTDYVANNAIIRLLAQSAALNAAVAALAATGDLTAEQITAAAEDGARQALDGYTLTLTPPESP